MDFLKLILLKPSCCPNCGYDLRPDNPVLPVKSTQSPGVELLEGLFNYAVKQVPAPEPSQASQRPKDPSPIREGILVPERKAFRKRSRRSGRKSKAESTPPPPEVPPKINEIQKRLLKLAGQVEIPSQKKGSPEREDPVGPESPVPVVTTTSDEPYSVLPAIPSLQQDSIPGTIRYGREDIDRLLTELLQGVEEPAPPIESPRATKRPWQGHRFKTDNFVRQIGEPPEFENKVVPNLEEPILISDSP